MKTETQSGKSDENDNEMFEYQKNYETMGIRPTANVVLIGASTNSDIDNIYKEPLTDREVNSPESLSVVQKVCI